MNTRKFLTMGMLVLVSLALTIAPVSARTTRIEVQADFVQCSSDPGDVWISDGIYHSRNGLLSGPRIPLSLEDPIQELEWVYSTINLNLNLKTHKGNGWGPFTSKGFEGIWNGKLTEIAPGIWATTEGMSIGHGFGPEFEGWELRVKWASIDPAPFAGICDDGADPVSANHGYVTYLIPGQ